jgi:biopolymer transport protein ExbD
METTSTEGALMFGEHYSWKCTEDDNVNLMPFINFLVVLIPVLMLSAEFSAINILEAAPADAGVQPYHPSGKTPEIKNLVICLSDSSVILSANDRFLWSMNCTAQDFPEPELDKNLRLVREKADPGMNTITIASDAQVAYQRLIDVMDCAKKNGFGDITIAKLRG